MFTKTHNFYPNAKVTIRCCFGLDLVRSHLSSHNGYSISMHSSSHCRCFQLYQCGNY